MAYQQRTEYSREVNRDDDRDQKSGGWKSWFGLGDNKDRDEDNYKATTTYRTENPSYGYSGQRSTYPERSGYSGAVSTGYTGARGGYGYTTSDEVNRGPSWNTDRDYTTRTSYGQPTGDRDVYYKQETRTYGGQDREYRPTGDNTMRSFMPSRSYGFSGDYAGRDYGRDYTPSRGECTTSRYQSDRDYTPVGRGYGGDRDYNYSRTYTTGGDRDYGCGNGRNTGSGYGGPEPASRSYGYGDSRGYSTGYNGGYGETSTYTRPSYQSSSYRY